MKFRTFFAIAVLIAVSSISSPALAVNLIYEPFDYADGQDLGPPSPGSLTYGLRNTQAGTTAGTADNTTTSATNYPDGGIGNKWLKASTAAQANSIDIVSGNLTGPSELKGSVGNSLSITDGTNNGAASRLAFRATQGTTDNITTTGTTIYYSFLLRVDDLTGSNNGIGGYFISLNNTANNNTTANPTVVPGNMRARIDPGDETKFSLGMFTEGGASNPSAADPGWVDGLTVGETMFVVGAFQIGPQTGGTQNNTKLWINPDQASFGAGVPPTPTAQDTTGAVNGTSIGSLLIHQQNAAPGLTLDEIRVATTWAEVTPPGTLSFYWDIDADPDTAGAGGATPSGTWDSSTNWNNSSDGIGDKQAWAAGSAAVFSAGNDATGAYTVTVSGTQSASTIMFEDGAATLTGGSVELTGAHTITAGTNITATIESEITGSVGLVKAGAGTLVLTANESYSGDTTVNAGTLQVGDGGTAGTLPTGSDIATNGTLAFNQSDAVTQGVDFTGSAITGTGGLTQAGSGTLTLNTANTFSGNTRVAAGTLSLTNSMALQNSTLDMNGADTGAVSIDSSLTAVTLGGITGSRNLSLTNSASAALALTVGNSNALAGPYSGALSGSGSLTKIGTGTQTLSGANTYTGGTNIDGGTLQFAQTTAMPASGAVAVNSGGTLAVNAGGAGEWTDSSDDTVGGTIGSVIKGRGGQGTADQISWNSGSVLAVDTTNAPGAPSSPALTYNGVIGSFRTTGGGTIDAVGFTKRGTGTLTLSGNNTFSGQLSVVGGTLLLTGTNANAGSTMSIPTVAIGAGSTLRLGANDTLPNGSLINTQGPAARFELQGGSTQTIRSLSGNNGIALIEAGATLTIADQAGDDYVFGAGAGTANVHTQAGAKIYKTGDGTFTLFGDAGGNFNGEFILQNGRLNISRNQALGTNTGTGRLIVEGGQLGRTNTPAANFTYSVAFVDAHVFRYDLSDAPVQISQFTADTTTTLKQDNVEFEITNTPGAGRVGFLGVIRNHDPNPFSGDNPNAIRGITKSGAGELRFHAANTYLGPTTVEEGLLSVTALGTIGDYNQATVATLTLKDGSLGVSGSVVAPRTDPIQNPLVIDGNSSIMDVSPAALATSVLEFNSDSIVSTSGSITISNNNTSNNQSTIFRPTFTGSGFDLDVPVIISASHNVGTGVKSNELQVGNSTGVQTFSGVISGGGSLRRINSGGTTVLTGANSYTGGTTVEDGTLTASGDFATFGAGDVVVTGGLLDIVSGVDDAILNSATLDISGTGMVSLGSLIDEQIANLVLGGAPNPDGFGTYGSTLSGADFQYDQWFTGTGIITVADPGVPGDINGDGLVNILDYVVGRIADAPGTGQDLTDWAANYTGALSGSGSGANAAVPEPATAILLLVGLAATAIYRRGR